MYTWTESVLSRIADISLLLRLTPSLFFFSLHYVNYVYPQRDGLCLRVWEQLSKRDREKEKQEGSRRLGGKKSLDLQRKARLWSDNLTHMVNGREIGITTLILLLLFNFSACFLLPLSCYCSSLNKGFLCSSAQALHTVQKALHSKNIRLIYTVVIRPLDLKQSGTPN